MKTPYFDKDEAGSGRHSRRATKCDRKGIPGILTLLYPTAADWQTAFRKTPKATIRKSPSGRVAWGNPHRPSARSWTLKRNSASGSNAWRTTLRSRRPRTAPTTPTSPAKGQLENLFTLIGESQAFVEPEIMAASRMRRLTAILADPGPGGMAGPGIAQAPPPQTAHPERRRGASPRSRPPPPSPVIVRPSPN